MGARENGEERNDQSTDVEVERDAKLGKEAESDYEAARDSFSSQGESNSNEDTKAKRVSRVPKKLAKKDTKPNSPRLARTNSTRLVNKKLQYISPNNSPNKAPKPSKVANGVKTVEVQRPETVEVTSCPSSDVSEETNDKAIEGRATHDKSTEGRANDNKTTEGRADDNKATEGTTADDKAIEGVETDDKAIEGVATDDKAIEGVATDDKAIEVIATDDKGVEGVETSDTAIEEAKEIDVLDEAPKCDQSTGTDDEIADTEQNILDDDNSVAYEKNDEKIEELESKIEKLEQELREVAALEVSLYSIMPEHGCSSHKLHTPARRLSRLYIHASKFWSPDKKASVAKNSISGLVLVAKSCGNDVSRLTFWLSNTIVLREIIAQTFGISSQSPAVMNAFTTNRNSNAKKLYKNSPPMRWKMNSSGKQARPTIMQFPDDWQQTGTVLAALEKIESWIFSRIVESVWWQTAFCDVFSRICPLRAGGHECGCLPVLAKLVMEQCVARLDVALFNAILRESENEIPSDPISDPILDSRVLPIPAGNLSFGSGAQLKNAVGSWSRLLTDMFGMDGDDSHKDGQGAGGNGDVRRDGAESNSFKLLNELSDLLMLPKDMLLEKSIRKEVCPSIGLPLVTRILCNFTPDEFCPDPVPGLVLEELNSEHAAQSLLERFTEKNLISTFPCTAAAVAYRAPSSEDVAEKVANTSGTGEVHQRASMVQRRGYTSDDDLDDLGSPLMSLYDRSSPPSPCDGVAHFSTRQEGAVANVRYELLREVWSERRD
ncbi:unnamed protein product [Triticum turgidum subsp. durum]|uniref:Dilute domain-containing protein n=1 Tax=Triticum turgidum subsp. durum TaxID=4567 RepID=A0A9R0XC34_TRITD|nr:unnamed protein product [Triticum turgidum subsp. durum]